MKNLLVLIFLFISFISNAQFTIGYPVRIIGNTITPAASADSVLGKKIGDTKLYMIPAPSGGGTPAGSTTEVQFNNAGAFGASSNFVWNGVNGLSVMSGASTNNVALTVRGGTTDAFALLINNTANSATYHSFLGEGTVRLGITDGTGISVGPSAPQSGVKLAVEGDATRPIAFTVRGDADANIAFGVSDAAANNGKHWLYSNGDAQLAKANTTGTPELKLTTTSTTINSLVGSGDRMVIASSTGVLSTQTIPTSGVTTMAAIGSSANANGASISGSTLTLQPASASFGGVVTTGTQTFAGAKTFNGAISTANDVNITSNGSLVMGRDDATNVNGLTLVTQTGSTVPTTTTSGTLWINSSGTLRYLYNGNSVDVIGGGSGTVTSFAATDGNGFDFTVTDATTTPTLTATTTVTDDHVMVSNSGAISGSADLTFNASKQLQIGGATNYMAFQGGGTTNAGLYFSTSNPTAGSSASTLAFGSGSTIVEAGSGDHPTMSTISISPATVTGGSATVTRSATVYIGGPMTATVSGRAYSLLVDDGETRFMGGVSYRYTSQSGAYSPSEDDYIIDCASGTFTVSLPAVATAGSRMYIIKNSGAGVITIDGNASETIDGATTYSLASQYKYVQIVCTGTAWIVVGNN